MKKPLIAVAAFLVALALFFVAGRFLAGAYLLNKLGIPASSVSWHTVTDIMPLLAGNRAMVAISIPAWIIQIAPLLVPVVVAIMAAVVLLSGKKPSLHGDAAFATAKDLMPFRYIGPYLPVKKK